jgi:vacuolar-type H+-ATPase subunit E/Vma4
MKKAVEQIQKAVVEEAKAEAAHILREAQDQLQRLLEDARRDEERKAEARLQEGRARLEQNLLREVARAQREARLACLDARNRVLECIFSRAMDEALQLPPARYREILRRWLGELETSAGGDILPAARDAEALAGLIGEMNPSRDEGSRLTLSREMSRFLRGFIFSTPRYEVTKSLEAWMEEQKRSMAPWLEKELFGEAGNAHAD